MRHHAARHILRLHIMTRRSRARLPYHTQITRINEPHKLPTLTRQQRVRSFRIRTTVFPVTPPIAWKQRLHMRLFFDLRSRIPPMTRRTTQPDRILPILNLLERLRGPILMHRLNLPMTRHTPLDLHRHLFRCRCWPGSEHKHRSYRCNQAKCNSNHVRFSVSLCLCGLTTQRHRDTEETQSTLLHIPSFNTATLKLISNPTFQPPSRR